MGIISHNIVYNKRADYLCTSAFALILGDLLSGKYLLLNNTIFHFTIIIRNVW